MRVTPNVYVLGAVPVLEATFKNLAGVLTDPTGITFKIIEPAVDDADPVVTEYVFGVDSELVRDSDGVYHVEWTARVAGDHCYRFEGTGDVRAALERHFTVDAGCFA